MMGRQAIYFATGLLGITILVVAFLPVLRGPEHLDLSVGNHELSVTPPRGFKVVEHDGETLFRKRLAVVALADLGPLDPVPDAGPAFDDLMQLKMHNLGFTEQREVSRRRTLHVEGRMFRIIETWDRLSHNHPRRFAFVLNGDSLLVLHTRPGDFSRAARALDEILNTITFRYP